jgi:hypothetical protein
MADMPEQDHRYARPETEERRSQAIVAFLGAGLHAPPPTALMVEALANARRSIAASRSRGEPIDRWIADEVRSQGMKGNAAILAVLELPEHRQEAAQSYASRHPDRIAMLSEVLAALG